MGMQSPDLTILIPTFNRPKKVESLLKNLEEFFSGFNSLTIEIIISDNHSNPEVKLPDSLFLSEVSRIVVPPMHLDTAEENLLFGMSSARGNYTWVLGDDDAPLHTGIQQLVRLVLDAKFDLMIFNSMGLDPVDRKWTISRLQIDNFVEKTEFKDFVRKAGFWSLPAGFSTLVFRTSKFDVDFMSKLHKQSLKIYTHVTTLLRSYHDTTFAAIAIPLVQYSSNSFDDESPTEFVKGDHWVNYSRRNQRFYRDPWTYSFLRQIEILDQQGIFTKADLFLTIDQGHLGNRFMLFDTILGFLVDQLIYEQNFPIEFKISTDEIHFVLSFLGGVNGEIDEIIKVIDSCLKKEKSFNSFFEIRASLLSEEQQVDRRLFFDFAGGKIFNTPYGFYWTPQQLKLNADFKSHSTPAFGPCAQTLEDLEPRIADWKSRNSLLNNLQGLTSLNTRGMNSLVEKFDKFMKRIPKSIRRRF